MRKIYFFLLFYYENSKLNYKKIEKIHTLFGFFIGMLLISISSYKLIDAFDWFNLIYFIFGIYVLIKTSIDCFKPSYNRHQNIIKNHKYKNIEDYYFKNQ